MTTPHRRVRFSLQTLFVAVTIVGCWLGWNGWLVYQRHGAAQSLDSFRWRSISGTSHSLSDLRAEPSITIVPADPPLLWKFLGAGPAPSICFPIRWITPEERIRLEALFPESNFKESP